MTIQETKDMIVSIMNKKLNELEAQGRYFPDFHPSLEKFPFRYGIFCTERVKDEINKVIASLKEADTYMTLQDGTRIIATMIIAGRPVIVMSSAHLYEKVKS